MTEDKAPSTPTWMLWSGRVISGLAVLPLLPSAYFKFFPPADMAQNLEHIGWPEKVMLGLGITELACVILYAIPQTSVLGAILFTGYMGGAIATHLRIGEPFFIQAAIGIFVWLGLYLRDPRLRAILPLRSI
jgi:hypothetical protein